MNIVGKYSVWILTPASSLSLYSPYLAVHVQPMLLKYGQNVFFFPFLIFLVSWPKPSTDPQYRPSCKLHNIVTYLYQKQDIWRNLKVYFIIGTKVLFQHNSEMTFKQYCEVPGMLVLISCHIVNNIKLRGALKLKWAVWKQEQWRPKRPRRRY